MAIGYDEIMQLKSSGNAVQLYAIAKRCSMRSASVLAAIR